MMDGQVAALQVKAYHDFSDLHRLKGAARHDDPKALKVVAQQFESLFLQMVLKSVREATNALKSDLLNSHDMKTYEEMYHQELANHLSQHDGIGLAPILVKQLSQSSQPHGTVIEEPSTETFHSPLEFIQKLLPLAKKAAKALGLDPKLLLAQAALETHWGEKMIKNPGGKNSYNLFGIKAQKDDTQVKVTTHEFFSGKRVLQEAPFKQYHSFEESFQDYIELLESKPRYQSALAHCHEPKAFMQALSEAGYATDPHYAHKVLQVYAHPWIQHPEHSGGSE